MKTTARRVATRLGRVAFWQIFFAIGTAAVICAWAPVTVIWAIIALTISTPLELTTGIKAQWWIVVCLFATSGAFQLIARHQIFCQSEKSFRA
jgi:hypothetical protein